MPKILEVIVTSEDEATEAEAGGADRLELVRGLDVGGLTPGIALLERVLHAVRIPVRVMLREKPSLACGGAKHLEELIQLASVFANLPVDGLVLGFVENGQLDLASTRKILQAAPNCRATFHRAFDEAADPLGAIAQLMALPQIDRILTSGGPGLWDERKRRLISWQQAALPGIKMLVGLGLCECALSGLRDESQLMEAHVGRAARAPQTVDGQVHRERVAALKSALQ